MLYFIASPLHTFQRAAGVPYNLEASDPVRFFQSRDKVNTMSLRDLIVMLDKTNVGVKVQYYNLERAEGSPMRAARRATVSPRIGRTPLTYRLSFVEGFRLASGPVVEIARPRAWRGRGPV